MHLSQRALLIAGAAGILLTGALSFHANSAAEPDAVGPDGGRYYGPIVNGRFQGRGRMEWDNGDRYEGQFVDGRFSGQGRMKFSKNSTYEGQFREGRIHGTGRMELPDGSVYVGDFRDSNFFGKGRLDSPTGYWYAGEFEYGYFHGKGHYVEKGSEYTGDFQKGRFWGEGEGTQPDGSKYRGSFVQGRWHGKGRFENVGKEVYEGDFRNGEFTGKGTYLRPDGWRYEGEFEKWQPHGTGKYSDPQGAAYEARFTRGNLDGRGKFTGNDGTVYEGGFKNWVFDGQGELRLANGDVYKGGFQHGRYQGQGTLTYARPLDGKSQVSGVWEFGELASEGRGKNAVNVETALYNQRRLLDEALASLAPRDPAKVNLYMLAVAGDGSQEVFRREVEFVRNQFAGRFGTGGRTIALINSRKTVDSAPMATLTSIGESVKAIAAKMDKEKDILFVYLSSHGSKQHELSLDQNNMDLRDLSAKDLAAMLRESGIRWKVLVVSACYAGGFINPVKDERTLIIAAARDDRRSFGCADENDFTYFGEAFFKEALPQSTSFPEAFEKARVLVEKREAGEQKQGAKADKESFSMPQIYNPDKIDQYLRKWWAQAAR